MKYSDSASSRVSGVAGAGGSSVEQLGLGEQLEPPTLESGRGTVDELGLPRLSGGHRAVDPGAVALAQGSVELRLGVHPVDAACTSNTQDHQSRADEHRALAAVASEPETQAAFGRLRGHRQGRGEQHEHDVLVAPHAGRLAARHDAGERRQRELRECTDQAGDRQLAECRRPPRDTGRGRQRHQWDRPVPGIPEHRVHASR